MTCHFYRLLTFTATLLILLSGLSFSREERSSVFLIVNSPKVSSFDFAIGNITIGNPKIVDFKADRKTNRVTLFPKASGNTLLLVYDQKGVQRSAIELTVYSSDPNQLLEQVRQLLIDVEGVTISRLNERVLIDGEVLLPDDKKRISAVVSANSKHIVDLTTMSASTDRILAKKIQSEIGLDEVRVRSVRGRIVLEGVVYSKQSSQKADQIARIHSENVINVLEIREVLNPPSRQPTIQISAHFVEMAKNFSKNFNFRWNPVPRVGTQLSYSFNPVSGSDSFTGAVTGSATDLLPKLNYFRALGVARVLENPSVSVKSGETATIESGTRVGFPVAQGNGTVSIEFHDVGAKLKIRPYVQGTDIDMAVEIKISSLGAPTVNGSVNIEQSSVETTQIVRSGESVVIGGLVRQAYRQFLDRPPSATSSGASGSGLSGQSDLVDPFPLGSLFTLFKSSDVSKQKSQFLVFITPKILQHSKDANQELKDQFNLYEIYPDQGAQPRRMEGQ